MRKYLESVEIGLIYKLLQWLSKYFTLLFSNFSHQCSHTHHIIKLLWAKQNAGNRSLHEYHQKVFVEKQFDDFVAVKLKILISVFPSATEIFQN